MMKSRIHRKKKQTEIYAKVSRFSQPALTFSPPTQNLTQSHAHVSHQTVPTVHRPWKQLQLAYLRSIQSSDLRRRRITMESKLAMFVARRVAPMANPDVAKNTPLIVDLDRIQNLQVDMNMDYVRGEVLGFCEVSECLYGLGDS
jgi:hypothetical protein